MLRSMNYCSGAHIHAPEHGFMLRRMHSWINESKLSEVTFWSAPARMCAIPEYMSEVE